MNGRDLEYKQEAWDQAIAIEQKPGMSFFDSSCRSFELLFHLKVDLLLESLGIPDRRDGSARAWAPAGVR